MSDLVDFLASERVSIAATVLGGAVALVQMAVLTLNFLESLGDEEKRKRTVERATRYVFAFRLAVSLYPPAVMLSLMTVGLVGYAAVRDSEELYSIVFASSPLSWALIAYWYFSEIFPEIKLSTMKASNLRFCCSLAFLVLACPWLRSAGPEARDGTLFTVTLITSISLFTYTFFSPLFAENT
jgi:arginine exporter protein ArgO